VVIGIAPAIAPFSGGANRYAEPDLGISGPATGRIDMRHGRGVGANDRPKK
jgi:hypothetical protein